MLRPYSDNHGWMRLKPIRWCWVCPTVGYDPEHISVR